jgi:hypothetical protein
VELNDFDDELDEIEQLLAEAGERARSEPVAVPPFDPCLRRCTSTRHASPARSSEGHARSAAYAATTASGAGSGVNPSVAHQVSQSAQSARQARRVEGRFGRGHRLVDLVPQLHQARVQRQLVAPATDRGSERRSGQLPE